MMGKFEKSPPVVSASMSDVELGQAAGLRDQVESIEGSDWHRDPGADLVS